MSCIQQRCHSVPMTALTKTQCPRLVEYNSREWDSDMEDHEYHQRKNVLESKWSRRIALLRSSTLCCVPKVGPNEMALPGST